MSEARPRILVLHGPNLDLLGRREPEIYGTTTLAEIDAELQTLAGRRGVDLETVQTNHEGVLIERLHDVLDDGTSAVLINPAGLTHTSVVLRDALAALPPRIPVVEVHLSVPEAREPFRHVSLVAAVVRGRVSGFGSASYRIALEGVLTLLGSEPARAAGNPE